MIPRSAVSLVAAELLAFASAATLTAQVPGRIEFRALAGAAVPVAPSEFTDSWSPGPGAAVGVAYALAPGTALGVEAEFARYPHAPFFPPVEPIPEGQVRTNDPPASLWAAWLDGSHSFLSGGIQPRLHGGIGAVAFGATRTGLGLRLGAGLDLPLAPHLAMVLDATFAHAFISPGTGYALDTSYSYLPVRVGVSWQ
jgi:hypothetical protein